MRLVVHLSLDYLVLLCFCCSAGKAADFAFLKPGNKTIVAHTGNALSLDCETSDASAQVSLWYKDLQSNPEKDISKGKRVHHNGQMIQIFNITLKDGGLYFCKAEDSNGQKIEKFLGRLFIRRESYKYPRAHMVEVSKRAKVLSDVNLTCYSFGDGIKHVWFKDGKILSADKIEVRTKVSGGIVLRESILHLDKVKPEDGGEYVCRVNSSYTPGHQHNATAVLQITAVQPLKWLGEHSGGLYYFGDSLEINCNLTRSWIRVSLWQMEHGARYKQRIPDGHLRQRKQIFQIEAITSNDSGFYQCRAENIEPHDIFSVYTSGEGIPKPRPKIKWYRRMIDFGDDVTLLCEGIGMVSLKWFKRNANESMREISGGTLSYIYSLSGKKLTKKTITIKSFDNNDIGYYRCVLERPLVKWRAVTEEFLQFQNVRKPEFEEFPKAEVTCREHEDHRFHVYVKGAPDPSLTWYRVNKDNSEDILAECPSLDTCGKMLNDEIKDLYISPGLVEILGANFSVHNNLTLKCVAKNYVATVNRTFHINVTAMPQITKFSKASALVAIYPNAPETKIICAVKIANPRDISYIWQMQTYTKCANESCKPRERNWYTLVPSENYHIKSNSLQSVLTLKKNTKTIFVRCTAKNSLGSDNHVWKLMILAETQKLLQSLVPTVATDQGKNVSLSCEADPSVIDVTWQRNNVDLPRDPRFSINQSKISYNTIYTLEINNASHTDGGIYKCVGARDGQDPVSESISLTVRDLSIPVVYLDHRVVMQPASFQILCNATGYPKPNITWQKDGQLLSNLQPLPSIKSCSSTLSGIYRKSSENKRHNAILIICKSDYKKHSGLFTCTASNKLGNHSVSSNVNVTAVPAIIQLKEKYEAEIGERFSLTCVSTGNPAPRVWWEKKEKDSFKPLHDMPGNLLMFEVVENKDLGSYRCVAVNKFKTVTTEIILDEKTIMAASQRTGPDNSKKYAVVIGCVSFAVLCIVIVVAVILYKRKKAYGGFYILTLPPLTDYIKKLDPHTPLTEQTNKLPYDAEWEFPRNRLKFSRELGSGAFGKVFLAEALGIVAFDPRGSMKRRSSKRRFGGSVKRNQYVNNNKMTKVAVKTLKEDAGETEYKDLLSELKILIHVGEHKNIVNLLGACTKGRESELWVIIEYCSNGNLLQFLRNRRDIYEPEWRGVSKDPNCQLTMTDLVIVAYQIARGMEFLSSRMCIHRDLATRNILLTDNYVVKIADFGLARDVGTDSQYVKTSTGLLPVKWMAIEAIIERLFTEKSDVWSFGIVLWELFTLGGTPYPNISPNEVCEFLALGSRMDPPHLCPDEISSFMNACWQDDRDDRPNFKEVVELLDKIIELHTSSEGGCGYLEVQGDEGINEYLLPSDVKTPQMDPFELNSPLPPIPSPGNEETDSLLDRDQNSLAKWFKFDKSIKNKAVRQDSELEKVKKDREPETSKDIELQRRGSDIDGYIDTSLTGKEKERIERDLDKDRDSSEEPRIIDDYAYWSKTVV